MVKLLSLHTCSPGSTPPLKPRRTHSTNSRTSRPMMVTSWPRSLVMTPADSGTPNTLHPRRRSRNRRSSASSSRLSAAASVDVNSGPAVAAAQRAPAFGAAPGTRTGSLAFDSASPSSPPLPSPFPSFSSPPLRLGPAATSTPMPSDASLCADTGGSTTASAAESAAATSLSEGPRSTLTLPQRSQGTGTRTVPRRQ